MSAILTANQLSDQLLNTVTCATCAVRFGLNQRYERLRRDDHNGFHCPNGHSNVLMGKTTEQRLREELEAEQRRHAMTKRDRDEERASRVRAEHGRAIVRGQRAADRARAKTRARAGVCPVRGCRRHFADLERHVASKHAQGR